MEQVTNVIICRLLEVHVPESNGTTGTATTMFGRAGGHAIVDIRASVRGTRPEGAWFIVTSQGRFRCRVNHDDPAKLP